MENTTIRETRENPLHKLVGKFQGKSVDQIFEERGLNFTIDKVPMVTSSGDPSDIFGLQRRDTKEVFGPCGRNYEIVQNDRLKDLISAGSDRGEFLISNAGSFHGGSKVYVEAVRPGPKEVAKGDYVGCAMVFQMNHNRTGKATGTIAPKRLSCLNGATVSGAKTVAFAVAHYRGANLEISKFIESVRKLESKFDETMEQYRLLAGKQVSGEQQVREYVHNVFQIPTDKDLNKRNGELLDSIMGNYNRDREAFGLVMAQYAEPVIEVIHPHTNLLETIIGNFEGGVGSDIPSTRGTLWNLYNGVTEYLTHQRGRTADSRLESLWNGTSAQLNERALNLALGMV